MGLFDKFKSTNSTFTPAFRPRNENGAIVALIIATANADGESSDAEQDYFLKALMFKKWFLGEEIIEYFKPAMFALREQSPKDLIDASTSMISPERRATVFAICCEVALADGRFDDKEKELLEYIAAGLNISDDLALKIIEVLVIKSTDNQIFTS